jgi:hypothetical protein
MIKLFFGLIRDKREGSSTSVCRNCVLGLLFVPWLGLGAGPEQTWAAHSGRGLNDPGDASLQIPDVRHEAAFDLLFSQSSRERLNFERRLSLESDPGEVNVSSFRTRISASHPQEEENTPDMATRLALLEERTFISALTLKSATMPLHQLALGPAMQPTDCNQADAGGGWMVSRVHSEISVPADEPDSGGFFFSAGNIRETFVNASSVSAEPPPFDPPLTQIMQAHTILPSRSFLQTDLFRYIPEERTFHRFEGLR